MTLFAMCLAFSFTSCGDDEEKGKDMDESLLIGKWTLVREIYEDKADTWDNNYKASDEVDVIEFKKSGACRNYSYIEEIDDYDWDDRGDWALSGDNLSLLFYGEGQTTVQVESLTASRLTFTANGREDGESYRYEMTYQKID